MECLFVKIQHFYVITVIASLHCFLILLQYKQNNVITTTRLTTTIIVINIEEKNEMIRKILIDIRDL